MKFRSVFLPVLLASVGCSAATAPPTDGGFADPGGGDATIEVPLSSMCGAPTRMDSIELDHTDCSTRTVTVCPAIHGASQYTLERTLLNLAQNTCRLPSFTYVRVDFISGCPAVLSVTASSLTRETELVDCLTNALADQRWDCALDRSCALVEWDTVF